MPTSSEVTLLERAAVHLGYLIAVFKYDASVEIQLVEVASFIDNSSNGPLVKHVVVSNHGKVTSPAVTKISTYAISLQSKTRKDMQSVSAQCAGRWKN